MIPAKYRVRIHKCYFRLTVLKNSKYSDIRSFIADRSCILYVQKVIFAMSHHFSYRQDEFLELNESKLVEIFSNNDIFVENEETVFLAAVR